MGGTAAALVAAVLVRGAAACGDETPTVLAPERTSAPETAAHEPALGEAAPPTTTSEDGRQVPPPAASTPGTSHPCVPVEQHPHTQRAPPPPAGWLAAAGR